jgi:hypothetical protein
MKVNHIYNEIEGEKWIEINGFDGLYSISNLGRVRAEEQTNFLNYLIRERIKTIKSIFNTKTGYRFVCLHKDGVVSQFYVHRLVAQHFIPNPENKKHVNHINGIKSDNDVNNLEWCTQKENNQHAFRTGLNSNLGIKNRKTILTEEQVKEIKLLLRVNTTDQVLNLFGWDKSKRHLIANIKCGRLWKSVVV